MKNKFKLLKLKLKKKPKPVKPMRFDSISLKKATFNTGHITVFNKENSMIAVIGKTEKPRQFSKFSLSEASEITHIIQNFDKVYATL